MGISIEPDDVVFLGFGLRLDYLSPVAIGIAKLKINSNELCFDQAIDKWEGHNFLEDFSIETLKPYLKEAYPMSATAKLTLLLALINQYGYEKVKIILNER